MRDLKNKNRAQAYLYEVGSKKLPSEILATMTPAEIRRRGLFSTVFLGATGLALAGVLAFGGMTVAENNHQHDLEMEQLSKPPSLDEPYKVVKVADFQGAQAIVRAAYPDAINDPERFNALIEMVQSQGQEIDGHRVLMFNQGVRLSIDAVIGRLIVPVEQS